MGFLEAIAEAIRRGVTGDDWYHKNEPYVLELRTTPNPIKTGFIGTSAYLVLPLGPEGYNVTRIMRQSVTPTLGGLVAEEQGMLWRMITVNGSFGLSPKFAFDTSLRSSDPLLVSPVGGILSGPGWTRRMIRNYFDKYAALKADPETAAETKLIWHDIKTDDHWIVVPEEATIDRNVQRRMQYPYSFRLKAIADADALLPKFPLSVIKGLGKVAQAIAAVNKGAALINSAIQEGSRLLGEIRFFVATIDSIIDKLNTIVTSANDFVNGVTDTLSVGRNFVTSTAAVLDSALTLMETADDLPDTVRQNYAMALDGVHLIAAQVSAFGTTYQSSTKAVGKSEGGANREARSSLEATASEGPPATVQEQSNRRGRSTDTALVDANALSDSRTFANYNGFRDYAIQATDTLPSIAASQLGDGALWYDIAIVNGLKAPYISPDGAPGTVRVGDLISIPRASSDPVSGVVAGVGSEPGERLLGTDIALRETSISAPGRPWVDLAIDPRTKRDVKLISGYANLSQALQMRVWTERGHMSLLPNYGLRRAIGIGNTGAFLAIFRLNLRETFRADSRVAGVSTIRFEQVDDLLEVDVDIVPIGSETARTVSTSVV